MERIHIFLIVCLVYAGNIFSVPIGTIVTLISFVVISYDKYLWKWQPWGLKWQKLFLRFRPIVHKNWTVNCTPHGTTHPVPWSGTFTVHHDEYNSCSFVLKTANGSSETTGITTFERLSGNRFKVEYSFIFTPHIALIHAKTHSIQTGSTTLIITDDGIIQSGKYSNIMGNTGDMVFTKT